MRKTILKYVTILTFAGALPWAQAVIFDFDITYDGAGVSLDAGSDVPAGSVFSAGDGFDLTLSTSGNDFWSVDADFLNEFVPLTFFVLDGATRTANIDTRFFLDGIEVFNIVDTAVEQSTVHIGAQIWNLSEGLMFDSVVMDYDLLASTMSTTIQDQPGIFSSFGSADDRPFFNDDRISYNNVAAVSEPNMMALLGLGLLGMTLARRRHR